jgi:hypothetical protein
MIPVASRGRDPRRHGPGFQNLAIAGLLVVEKILLIGGLMQLPAMRVNADRMEQRLSSESAGLVRNDGDDVASDLAVLEQAVQHPGKGGGG